MIKSKRFPIFSTFIFGKIFDYKYVNKINLKDKKFTCTIDEIDQKKNNFLFVSEDLYKNESLFDEVFPLKILLEKELNLLKEWPVSYNMKKILTAKVQHVLNILMVMYI